MLLVVCKACYGTGAQVVSGYYKRRALRMLPSYYATLAFVRLAFLRLQSARWGAPEAKRAIFTLWFNARDGCPRALWANWVFANNQLPRAGCMKYAWSQAVQVAFFPHLLRSWGHAL